MEIIEWVIAVLAFICVCTNSYCLYYVIKTFNLKQCLNYIMCIDSSVAVITSAMIFTFYAIGIRNSFVCFEITFSIINFANLMAVCNFITAYIRYKRVLTSMNNQNWTTEKKLILITALLLGSLAMLCLVLLIIDVALGMEWFGFYSLQSSVRLRKFL